MQVLLLFRFSLPLPSASSTLAKVLEINNKLVASAFGYVSPLSRFQCCLNETLFDLWNIYLSEKGGQKDLNVCFRLDIFGNITTTL